MASTTIVQLRGGKGLSAAEQAYLAGKIEEPTQEALDAYLRAPSLEAAEGAQAIVDQQVETLGQVEAARQASTLAAIATAADRLKTAQDVAKTAEDRAVTTADRTAAVTASAEAAGSALAAAAFGQTLSIAEALADPAIANGQTFIERGTGKVYLKTSSTDADFTNFRYGSAELFNTVMQIVAGPGGWFYLCDAAGSFSHAFGPDEVVGPIAEQLAQKTAELDDRAHIVAGPDGWFYFCDAGGNWHHALSPDGVVGPIAERLAALEAAISGSGGGAGNKLVRFATGPDGVAYIADESGSWTYRFGPEGIEYIGGLLTNAAAFTDFRLRTPVRLWANWNHVIGQGQSNYYGTGTILALFVSMISNALMFSGGIRPTDTSGSSAFASAVPAGERVKGTTDLAETPMSATAVYLDRFLAAGGFNIQTSDVRLFLSNAATPSVSAEYRGQPTELAKANKHINEAFALAQAQGLSYQVLAFPVATGENASQGVVVVKPDGTQAATADGSRQTAAAFQAAELYVLDSMRDNYRKLVSDPTAQPLYLFNQLASAVRWAQGNWDIAFAVLDMCERIDHCICTVSDYIFDFAVADNLHTTAASKDLRAAYDARAIALALKGIKHRPLAPLQFTRQGKICTVRFRVPVDFDGKRNLPLVLDTARVTDPGNFGFVIRGSDGVALTISSVAVVADGVGDTVKIVCTTNILADATLEYATNGSSTLVGRTVGARGCLFDSATEIFDSNGLNIRMRNPCVIFRKVLP